jgi:hypothetical protein
MGLALGSRCKLNDLSAASSCAGPLAARVKAILLPVSKFTSAIQPAAMTRQEPAFFILDLIFKDCLVQDSCAHGME